MPPVFFANPLQPLIDATEWVMVQIHDNVVASWGLSIIGLTVIVRALLIPLTLKQFKSMQAMQRLQPEIKELQAKYKDDKQRMNQEMMKFYQENKVNPLGSCLPLVAQMPIFLSLFYMLRQDLRVDICGQTKQVCEQVDPGSAKFLFIPDLTASAKGGVLVALILLYVGTQLASSLLMSVSADKNQRRLILALPLVFVAFIINFPAGLILYWITTNLWTIGQQYLVKRTVGPIRPPALAGATAGAGGGSSGSSAAGSSGNGSSGNGSSGGGGGLLAALTGGGRSKEAEPVAPEKPVRKTPPPQSPRKKKKRSGRRR